MKTQNGFRPWVKGLLFWVTFLVLYALRKAAPIIPITLFAGVDESNFQHYKGTFFAYLILSLIEYLIYRKKVDNPSSYWYARLLAAVIAPWMVFLVWYLMPAVYGPMPNIGLEVLWGNVATLIVGFLAVTFEHGFEQMTFNRSLQTVTWVLVAVSIVVYTLLTFHLPWADVFTEPDWQEMNQILWRQYV